MSENKEPPIDEEADKAQGSDYFECSNKGILLAALDNVPPSNLLFVLCKLEEESDRVMYAVRGTYLEPDDLVRDDGLGGIWTDPTELLNRPSGS